jgi:2-methylcitrate dehydratase PrpD
MALLRGEVTVGQYEAEEFRKPEVRAFMQKIEVVLGEESERAWPGVPLNVLHLQLRGGARHTARVSFHVGHYERPMTDAQQEAKFSPLAARSGMAPGQAMRLLAALRTLEQAPDLSNILALATVA